VTTSIGIIGCGFAGLSSALFLSQRQDCEITLYDRFETVQAVGAGILIQPSSQEVLKKLNLYDNLVASGEKVFVLKGLSHYQKQVFMTRYKDYQTDSFGIGIHRSILFNLLYEACQKQNNIHFRLGEDIHPEHLADLQQQHNLVIIANGSHSQLRQSLPIKQSYSLYPYGCAWTSFAQDDYSLNQLSQYVRFSKEMFGVLPSGTINNQRMVSVFWSLPITQKDTYNKDSMFSGMQHYLQHQAGGESLLELIQQQDFAFAVYADVQMKSYFHQNMVVIGDAAHGMSPQLGQGANMALLDGYFLDKYLQLDNADTIMQSIAQYSRKRAQHLRFYSQASKFLTPLFQSDFIGHGLMRDALFSVSQKLPFSQKLSSHIMCGKRLGWWCGRELEY
jgi:2-polyprenyl-6-methoxyphenol hydroxylase-like FAD-dependent oxidoreductase